MPSPSPAATPTSSVDQQHLMKALLDQKLISELITRMGKDKDASSTPPSTGK